MAELETNVNESAENAEVEKVETEANDAAEVARLKSELAKQKAALDKATKEAGDYRKQLRAKQSAEEAAADEAKERAEAQAKELAELRKQIAVANTSKKIMAFVGDETISNDIAGFLYGSEDSDAVVDAFQKAWIAKEKSLRLEFGKIPAPGAGSGDGPAVTMEQLNRMTVIERSKFAREHRDEYNKMMGR